MDKDYFRKSVIDFTEFKSGSTTADVFINVTRQIINEESKKLVDETEIKRGEDWSALANQVVGSEHL
jgi:hypothetical protein